MGEVDVIDPTATIRHTEGCSTPAGPSNLPGKWRRWYCRVSRNLLRPRVTRKGEEGRDTRTTGQSVRGSGVGPVSRGRRGSTTSVHGSSAPPLPCPTRDTNDSLVRSLSAGKTVSRNGENQSRRVCRYRCTVQLSHGNFNTLSEYEKTTYSSPFGYDRAPCKGTEGTGGGRYIPSGEPLGDGGREGWKERP